jgi:hypothetical protein
MEKFIATALVVGVVGPLFWLGVKVLENKLKSLADKLSRRRRAKQSTTHR